MLILNALILNALILNALILNALTYTEAKYKLILGKKLSKIILLAIFLMNASQKTFLI
jgi:hypothetical protein